MAVSNLDPLWEIMSQYSFEPDAEDKDQNLKCGICKKLIADACHSVCGCQYCYRCIVDYIGDGDKHCDGGKDHCCDEYLVLDKTVFRNQVLSIKVCRLKLRCPNHHCQCVIEMSQMEDHLRVCINLQSRCPYCLIGCDNADDSKETVLTHLHSDTFKHSQLLTESIQNLRNEVEQLRNNAEKDRLEIVSLREELRLKNGQVREMAERGGETTLREEELKRTLEDQKKEIMKNVEEKMGIKQKEVLLQAKENIKNLQAQLDDQKKEQTKAINLVNEEANKKQKKILFLEKESNDMKQKLSKLEGERKTDKSQLDSVGRSVDDCKNKTKKCDEDIERRMNKLIKWNKLIPNIEVDFVWKIDECTKKMKTMTETGKSISSEPFYSNQCKLYLSMLIVDDDIYLSCKISRSDNEKEVHRPAKKFAILNVVNQETLGIHTRIKIVCDMSNSLLSVNSFIKYSSIKDDKSIVLNDSIIVSCLVSDTK